MLKGIYVGVTRCAYPRVYVLYDVEVKDQKQIRPRDMRWELSASV